MAIEAQLFDGTIVEFPDDTDRSVIEKTVKRLTAERQPKEPEEKESVLRQAADIPVNFAKGISQGVRMLSDAFGADNAVSANLRGVEDYLGGLLSAQAKNDQQEIAKIFKEAEDKGVLDQVQAGLKAFSVAPIDIMSQAFGTIIPTLAGGLAGRAIGIGARAAGVGTGATMGTGAGKSAIYDAVTEELKKSELPEEVIKQAATQAQEYGGKNLDLILANTLLGGVAAGTGIERALIPGMVKNISANVAKRGAVGRGLATGAPEFLTEGLQGGTEQVSQNVALQREGFDVPTFRGAGTAATMEAVAGGVLGGGIGAFSRPQAAPAAPPPDAGLNAPADTEALVEPPVEPQQPFVPQVVPQQYSTQQGVDLATGVQGGTGLTQADFLGAGEAAIQPGQRERAQGLAAQQFDLNANAPRQEYAPQFPDLAAAQQSIDGTRFQQQTPAPEITPAQTIPRTPTQPLNAEQMRQRIDEQSALVGQMQNEPFAFDRNRLSTQADVAGGTGQVRGAPQASLIDPNPMPPRAARQRLAVLKDEVESQGGNPDALAIVPHPTMGGRFAIEQRAIAQPYIAPPIETPTISRAAAQQRIEGSALQGSEQARLAQDKPRQEMISRVMRSIQERNGVASPEEAEILRQANMGQPYNQIDYGLSLPQSVDQRLTAATGIDLERPRRETITTANQVASREAAAEAQARAVVEERQRLNEQRRQLGLEQLAEDEQTATFTARRAQEAEQRAAQAQQQERYQQRQVELQDTFGNLPPNPREVIAALSTPSVARDAQQIKTVKLAQERMTPSDFSVLEMVADNPSSMPNALARIEGEHKIKYSLSNNATPELKEAAADLRKKLLPILKRFGLGNVGLRLLETIDTDTGKADGMYAKQIITLALDSDNPLGVMRHEVIHALKELGAFTPAEWKVLSKAAKDTWINQFFDRAMQDQYKQVYLEQNGSLDGFQEYLQEEAIAQAFRFFTDTKPPSGMIANLMRRLNAFFNALGNFLRGKGFNNIDEMFLPNRIFADIERGAIQPGRAQGRKEELPVYAFKPSKAPEGIPQDIYNLHRKYERMTAMANGRIPAEANAKGVSPRPQDLKREETMSFRRLLNAVENFTGDRSGEPNAPSMQMLTRMSELSRAEDEKSEKTAPKYSLTFNKTGDLTPLTVQKVRVYEKELEALTKKIGSRIAGMTSEQTVDDVRKAIKKLQSYTAQGLKGREWYERSAKAILDAFNGDPVLAEKLFQIIAITSANTEVAANFTKATNAWSQFANGRPIKVGTTDTNKKIEALLYFGIDWDGRKTNTFYTNLMEAMDGTDSGRSTIDLHMTRMIFGKDTPTDAQYELAENMVRLLASKLDIPPRQIQAASWVTQKAKGMFEDYRKRGIKKDLNDDELRQMTFERAITDYSHLMKAKVQKLRITPELSEPSPSIRARTQTITGEVIPSVKTPMSQVEKVDFANKEKLTKDVLKSNFISNIADTLGIESRIRVTVQSGAYEGKVNPNLKVEIINPSAETAENDARDLAYAMSYVFKQDATPFFRADPKLLNQAQYGVSLKFGKTLTPAMQKKILGVMNQYLGADAGFSKVGPTEIVMINYRGDDGNPFLMPDVDFIEALATARDAINQFAPIEDAKAFGAKSEYPYHDWEADTDGSAIIKRLQNSRGQRSYLQEQLVNLRESFIGKAREAIIKTGEKPKFSLRNFGSDQSALRPSPSSNAGISFNPVKEDAVSFQGSHYGKARTEVLNGAKYGQGLRGAEARRLEQSDDERIKRRVYFYIPRGNNTMPNREAGVGSYVYTQKLDNILAPGPTMGRLNKEAGGDANKFESLIVDNGYDGYAVPDFGMMVVMNQDVPVNYEGTVDEVHGGKKFSLRAPKTPKFKRFFGNSKITNPDGTPKVMYHGTARIIDEFIPKQAGAIFVTDNPVFAEGFASNSIDYMRNELLQQFPDLKEEGANYVLNKAIKDGWLPKKEADEYRDLYMKGLEPDFDNVIALDEEGYLSFLDQYLTSSANIMPLYVRAENPFDFENPAHIDQVYNRLVDLLGKKFVMPKERLVAGDWTAIEDDAVQTIIKDLGHDSFYVKEGGVKNLAVYNPNQIKSAIGNRGTYDETGRILYSLKNAPPNKYTKLADEPATEKAINNAVGSTFNAVRNEGTSLRNALVDKYSQLSRTLSPLPLFDSKGKLRGDMLLHSYAQATNSIKAGLVSGTPKLMNDGTIGIERSDNNLANAERLADKLDTNKNVIESGLTGRGYIATIARNLRGADILAEDRAAQQLGAQQLARANQMYAALNAEIKTGKLNAGVIAKRQQEINKLRKEGKENSRQKRELQVKPEDIAWAEKQLQMTPEVQDILDIWKAVNTSLVNLYEDTGMIDKETADKYRGQKNYVPLFKSREDLNEEAFFRTGTSPKTASKLKELKGADITRNIWENVTKQYAVMFAAAYENQTRRVSVEQMNSIDPDLAKITNKDDPRVNLRFRQDGKDVHAIIENPNDLAAFQSMTYQFGPVMQFFGGFTKLLRAGALLNPMFWLRQLIRDPISASITGQAGIVTPFHSAKEFLAILTRNSEEARVLASRGVIGQFDTTVSLNEFLGNVGKNKQAAPGFIQNSIQKLMEIHEASDAATRVAVYKKAKAKALKDGMSEPQAVDYAVFKARESINFALTGNSPALAAARQMIPFLNATIVGLDTLYRAATGYGLNPEEKAKARSSFRNRAIMMVMMSVAYAYLMGDDDEYNKLPDHVKDNNWLFPIIGLDGKKKFIRIPVPYEVGYLFKTLPEAAYRYLNGTSTGKEVAKSIGTGFLTNLPTGGTPVPQFAKPALEAITNHSFFTWNPIESVGDARLPVAQRGRKASEISKVMSEAGLDKIGLSPAKIDTLTKGYFAEFGNFFNELADAVLAVGSGKQRTAKDLEDMPFFKSFMADPQADKAVSTFYDHQKTAIEVANSFSKMKNEGRAEELQKLIADPEKRKMLVAAPALRKINEVMSTINKQIGIIDRDQSKSPAERRKLINELELRRNEIANRGVQVARELGL